VWSQNKTTPFYLFSLSGLERHGRFCGTAVCLWHSTDPICVDSELDDKIAVDCLPCWSTTRKRRKMLNGKGLFPGDCEWILKMGLNDAATTSSQLQLSEISFKKTHDSMQEFRIWRSQFCSLQFGLQLVSDFL
jgi:hypothetical protein